MPGRATQARPAGSPLGTVLEGPLTGEEVRPALPVVSPDPLVATSELDGLKGDVVVEVTIDEKGNIIQKVVVQSLAPSIDGKVLEALENWRFRPATRNGVAIASKQDVYYHFPAWAKVNVGASAPLVRRRHGLRSSASRYNVDVSSDQVRQVASADFPTRWGKFRIYGFRGEFGATRLAP